VCTGRLQDPGYATGTVRMPRGLHTRQTAAATMYRELGARQPKTLGRLGPRRASTRKELTALDDRCQRSLLTLRTEEGRATSAFSADFAKALERRRFFNQSTLPQGLAQGNTLTLAVCLNARQSKSNRVHQETLLN
jgi:hypothetical protein